MLLSQSNGLRWADFSLHRLPLADGDSQRGPPRILFEDEIICSLVRKLMSIVDDGYGVVRHGKPTPHCLALIVTGC